MHRHIWEQYHGKIPTGKVIHHKDGNKKNNEISNLECLTYKEHNSLHSKDRQVWNRGISAKTNKKWRDTIKKAHKSRAIHFIPIFEETYNLKQEGVKVSEIAKIKGISREQVYTRIKRYKEIIGQEKTE